MEDKKNFKGEEDVEKEEPRRGKRIVSRKPKERRKNVGSDIGFVGTTGSRKVGREKMKGYRPSKKKKKKEE